MYCLVFDFSSSIIIMSAKKFERRFIVIAECRAQWSARVCVHSVCVFGAGRCQAARREPRGQTSSRKCQHSARIHIQPLRTQSGSQEWCCIVSHESFHYRRPAHGSEGPLRSCGGGKWKRSNVVQVIRIQARANRKWRNCHKLRPAKTVSVAARCPIRTWHCFVVLQKVRRTKLGQLPSLYISYSDLRPNMSPIAPTSPM